MTAKAWLAAAMLLAAAVLLAAAAEPAVLRLERRLVNASMEHLIKMDQGRLARRGLLGGGVVELPVSGTGYDYLAGGPYLTRVQLGNPPKNFSVLIDTGSSMSWVDCQTPGGPSTQTGFFDPRSSSVLTCNDDKCQNMVNRGLAVCNASGSPCGYNLWYGLPGDAIYSSTGGFYISDKVQLDILKGNHQTSSISVPIIFGCSNIRSGELTNEDFDGIFGFGPYQMSFSSQLHSLGISPSVFSLCMKSSYGGGILILGEIVEPGLVYTQLITLPNYYKVNLESIAVNGQKLAIDPSVFTPSSGHQTIVDSGTTLAYLADGVYNPFVRAVAAAVSPAVRPSVNNGDRCFVTSSSVDLSFPSVTLHFADGATMTLKPKNYLRLSEDQLTYCIAWQRNRGEQVTLLGDIVLMDKIIVHDMENMRLGWMDSDCSRPVNITTSSGRKPVNYGHPSYKISIPIGVAVALMHVLIFWHP